MTPKPVALQGDEVDSQSTAAATTTLKSAKSARRTPENTQLGGVDGPSNSGVLPDDVVADPALSPTVSFLAVDAIVANRYQPRTRFDEGKLEELAQSIREHGVLQPVIVRAIGDGRYELIAGERRWRASQQAGCPTIPALVRELSDAASSEIALIENVQREDLDPVDRSDAVCQLASVFGLSQEQIAERIGLERSTVANLMRLRDLSEPVRALIRRGGLGVGHAKALLGADPLQREALAERAAEEGWSVRVLEREAKRTRDAASVPEAPTLSGSASDEDASHRAQIEELERSLSAHLGTRVELRTGRDPTKGSLTVHFYDLDQFDGLLAKMNYRSV